MGEALNRMIVTITPNRGHPVTHWLVVGPYFDAGQPSDAHWAPSFMFESHDDALIQARELVEICQHGAEIIEYPPDPAD